MIQFLPASEAHSVLLCHKPQGATSNRVLQRVKRSLGLKKAGHTGALDPLATGVLPLCFGEATKFSQFGLESVKCYRVKAKFGIETNTGDCDGDVIAETAQPEDLTTEKLRNIIEDFIGIQKQQPSPFSALKYEGRPLYEYARQGIEVPVPIRDICISQIKIEDINLENAEATLWVEASKGTYIRSLIQDIGRVSQWGAHVIQLHRTHAGLFHESACHTIALEQTQIQKQQLLPVSSLLLGLPWYIASGHETYKLDNGHSISKESVVEASHFKAQFLDYYLNMGIRFLQDEYHPLMHKFYQEYLGKVVEDQTSTEIALFQMKSDFKPHQLNPVDLEGKSLIDVITLKGLAEFDSVNVKPKRFISKGVEVI